MMKRPKKLLCCYRSIVEVNTDGEEIDRPGDNERENQRDPMSSVCFEDTSSTGTDNEMDTLMDSTVSSVSSQSTLSASSMNLSISSDSVWVGTTSDRFIHTIVILLIVIFHDLLKTNLCYIVLILGLLIFTVAAAAAEVAAAVL